MPQSIGRSNRVALGIAGGYLVLGIAYIIWSSELVSIMAPSAEVAARIEQWKGIGFIVVTASLLFFLVRRSHLRHEASEAEATKVARHLKMAVDAGRVMVWSLNCETGQLEWSENAADILDAPQGADLTTCGGFLLALDADCRQATKVALDDAHENQPVETTVTYSDVAGKKRFLMLRGEVQGSHAKRKMVGTALDVSQERQLEFQLQQHAQGLEAKISERTSDLVTANDELESFSYTVAHDLRSPLRAIISTSRILIEDHAASLGEDIVATLHRQEAAAKRMALLIDDLLTMSRFSRAEVSRVKFDLSLMAQEIVDELKLCDEHSHLAFEIDERMRTYADPKLVRVLLQNLIENACKFAKPEGGTVKIARNGDVFVVEDDGIGFNPAYATRLFKPFERLHGALYEGTGIGLATVKRIVDRHGGQIWAEGKPGEGASFFFSFPDITGPLVDPPA